MVLCQTSGIQKSKVITLSLVIRQADMVVLQYNITRTKLEQSCLSGLIFITLSLPHYPLVISITLFLSLNTPTDLCLSTFALASHPPQGCVFSMSFNCWLYFIIQVLAQVSTLSPVFTTSFFNSLSKNALLTNFLFIS